MIGSIASGLFSGRAMNAAHSATSSQRSSTNAWSISPSVTTTWAIALMTATLVPGRSWRWWLASMCGLRTRSIRRGSTTMSSAPARRRRFIRDAKTGWPSVGFAPMTMITSAFSTDAKSCVPAEVPNVVLRP